MTEKKSILLATHNSSKISEIRRMLEPLGFEIKTAADFDLPEPDETGKTLLENARIKAHAAAKAAGIPALSDDSGFEVDALGGDPGVYTANWAEGADGVRRDAVSMERIWLASKAAGADLEETASRARFRTTLVMAYPEGSEGVFSGVAEGQAIWPPRGQNGFGQDAMFVPYIEKGIYGEAMLSRQTFAEMSDAEKEALSHRKKAVNLLVDAIANDCVKEHAWKRVSGRVANMLEWLENPYTDRPHTLGFEVGQRLTLDGSPSRYSQHLVTAEDLSEAIYFAQSTVNEPQRDRIKMRVEGNSILMSLSKSFDGDDKLYHEPTSAVFNDVVVGVWSTPEGSDSYRAYWDQEIERLQNEAYGRPLM